MLISSCISSPPDKPCVLSPCLRVLLGEHNLRGRLVRFLKCSTGLPWSALGRSLWKRREWAQEMAVGWQWRHMPAVYCLGWNAFKGVGTRFRFPPSTHKIKAVCSGTRTQTPFEGQIIRTAVRFFLRMYFYLCVCVCMNVCHVCTDARRGHQILWRWNDK